MSRKRFSLEDLKPLRLVLLDAWESRFIDAARAEAAGSVNEEALVDSAYLTVLQERRNHAYPHQKDYSPEA
jgi:hypothetical protein